LYLRLRSYYSPTPAEPCYICDGPDESYILFVSSRPEDGNLLQIYVSFQIGDNQWTQAVRLGPEVNTKAQAGAPTLSADGKYLFFKRRDEPERGLYWISTEVIDDIRSKVFPAS
jgi:hypothetical protein